jgi:hypothetical protein
MTVSTRIISLSGEWQQITDGATTSFIQVKSGLLEYVVADAAPTSGTEGHTSRSEFTVTPPTRVWAKAGASLPCRLAVTPF